MRRYASYLGQQYSLLGQQYSLEANTITASKEQRDRKTTRIMGKNMNWGRDESRGMRKSMSWIIEKPVFAAPQSQRSNI